MIITILDCESTGIPKKNQSPYKDFDSYPHIIQVAWQTLDESQNKMYESNCYIRPVGFTISDEISKLTRITTEGLLKTGVGLKFALRHLVSDIQKSDILVGHNLRFDLDLIRANILKLELPLDKIDPIIRLRKKIDTMRETIEFCKIPQAEEYLHFSKYKFPKLSALYEKLFNEKMIDAHDAATDVDYTRKCFFELINRKIINY